MQTRNLPALPNGVPADVVSYEYDQLDNLARVSDNDSVVENIFDAASRLTATTQSWGGQSTTIGYSYDSDNRLVQMTDPTGITTYSYDTRSLLANLTDPGGNQFTFDYDPLGRLAQQTASNGVVTTPTYDPASQLLSLDHTLGASTVASVSYTLNNTGNRTSETRDHRRLGSLGGDCRRQPAGRDERERASQYGNTPNFPCDPVDRLLSVINSLFSGNDESFSYDHEGDCLPRLCESGSQLSKWRSSARQCLPRLCESGSLLSKWRSSAGQWTVENRQHDAANQLEESDQYTYEYNAEGCLIRRVSKTDPTDETLYEWDGLNRLTKVTTPTDVITYAYDPLGRRIERDEDGQIYGYDGSSARGYNHTNGVPNGVVHDPVP